MSAKLHVKYGSMNAGKTTALLQAIHNYEENNMKVFVIKPKIDKKGGDCIVSRLGLKRKVDKLIGRYDDMFDILKDVNSSLIDCIFIDEAQFLSKDQAIQCLEITMIKQIPVICYGLRSDSNGYPFEGSATLLALAHDIQEIKTICKCGRKATMNIRKNSKNQAIFNEETILIDNKEDIKYEAVCSSCFFNIINNK